ncbi:MAG: hypothetical protein Q4C70_12550 [Planctomycetia bacterium]|nr:hypothetical protein [Planctomycetia bacterium]
MPFKLDFSKSGKNIIYPSCSDCGNTPCSMCSDSLDDACTDDCKCGCKDSGDGEPGDPSGDGNPGTAKSLDPKEIAGPIGYDFEQVNYGTEDDLNLVITTPNWINGEGKQDYTIYFENKKTATAAAQEVRVDMALPEEFNAETFQFEEICVGSQIYKLDNSAKIAENTWLVDQQSTGEKILIQVTLDTVTRTAQWYLRSYVQSTPDHFPASAYDGFLPVNDDNGNGEGYVKFSVWLVSGKLTTNEEVTSKATIVFDMNDPIETNVWRNTLDVTAPIATLTNMMTYTQEKNINLVWTGSDEGSGIAYYDVYVSYNAGNWELVAGNLTETQYNYQFMNGSGAYSFKVVAVDNVGWKEIDQKAETTVNYESLAEFVTCVTTGKVDMNSHTVNANETPINEWSTFHLEFWCDEFDAQTFTISYNSEIYALNRETSLVQNGYAVEFGDETVKDGVSTFTVTLRYDNGNSENVPEITENTLFAALEFRPIAEATGAVTGKLIAGEGADWVISVDGNAKDTQANSVVYDLNDDGKVDIVDLVEFARSFGKQSINPDASNYTETAWQSNFDVSSNGEVDILDLVLFARNFGADATSATKVTYSENYVFGAPNTIKPIERMAEMEMLLPNTSSNITDLAMTAYWNEEEEEDGMAEIGQKDEESNYWKIWA